MFTIIARTSKLRCAITGGFLHFERFGPVYCLSLSGWRSCWFASGKADSEVAVWPQGHEFGTGRKGKRVQNPGRCLCKSGRYQRTSRPPGRYGCVVNDCTSENVCLRQHNRSCPNSIFFSLVLSRSFSSQSGDKSAGSSDVYILPVEGELSVAYIRPLVPISGVGELRRPLLIVRSYA